MPTPLPKPGHHADPSSPERLSRKELAKKARHKAYLRAKQFRKTDPRQIAMAEEMKRRRREAYQKAKARKKASVIQRKQATKTRSSDKKLARQAALLSSLIPASSLLPAAPNSHPPS